MLDSELGEEFKYKQYPEFGGLTGDEISLRLQALNNLLDNEMDTARLQENLESSPLELEADPLPETQVTKRDFTVIAHRGWSGSYPENTLIGMREAIKLGCHMIEFDVAMTQDRRLIIIHDNSLSRTTNGYGEVREHDFKELRNLDAGSWFHPRYAGTRLPSLEEILLMSRGSGIQVNIEIKKECWEDKLLDDGVENQIVQAVKKFGVQDRVIISSFRWGFLKRIHQLDQDLRLALLQYEDLGGLNPAELKQEYGVVAFNPHCIELTQRFVDQAHEAGLKVFPFTLNTYQDMEKYFDMGVDGMFTNHPNRLFKFIEAHNARITEYRIQESAENTHDKEEAIKKLEREELEKARKRTRWSFKRKILEAGKQ